MATVTLQGPNYYSAGTNVDIYNSCVVGFESKINRVARYSFTSPSSGASSVSVSFAGATLGDGTRTPLRFYIGTSSTDHANAGSGSTYTGEMSYSDGTWSGTANIILNPSTSYYLWVFPSTTTYGWWWWHACTASLTTNGGLKTVISGSNGTLGSSNTLTLTRYSDDFTHKITATCGTASTTISSDAQSDTVKWTPPIKWASQNVSATKVSVTVTCETYIDSTSVGSTSVTLTMSIPSSVIPTVSLSVSDANSYASTFGGYIQNKSKAKVTTTSEGIYGSSIVNCSITCDSVKISSDSGEFELQSSGTITVKATVTDSRGRSASASTKISVLSYTNPTAQFTTIYRCDEDGSSNYEGAYVYALFDANAAALSDKNVTSYSFNYRVRGTTVWTSISLPSIAGSYEPTGVSQIFAADTTKSYEICLAITDYFGTVESQYYTVSPVRPFLTLNRDANAIGLGIKGDMTNTLSIGLYAEFLAGTNLCNYGYNLLDNSDFTKPVNQRGQATYSGKTYTVDRWKSQNDDMSVAIGSNHISITNTASSERVGFLQLLEGDHAGKTYTVAICDYDTNNIYCAYFTVPETTASAQNLDGVDFNGHTCRGYITSGGVFGVRIMIANAATLNVKWVALYEGSYTTDTLPTYRTKGYAAELAECRRYCYVLPASFTISGKVSSSNLIIYTDSVQQFYGMRAVPSLEMSGTIVVRTIGGYSTATGFTTSSGGDVSLLDSYGVGSNSRSIMLTFSSSVAPANNTPVNVTFDNAIICSSDL